MAKVCCSLCFENRNLKNYRFDDSCVTGINPENVLRQQPYMLYYIRTSPKHIPSKIPMSPIQRQKSFESKPAVKSPENKFRNTFVTNNNSFEKKSPIVKLNTKFIGPERPKPQFNAGQHEKPLLKPTKFKPSNGYQKSHGLVKTDHTKKSPR